MTTPANSAEMRCVQKISVRNFFIRKGSIPRKASTFDLKALNIYNVERSWRFITYVVDVGDRFGKRGESFAVKIDSQVPDIHVHCPASAAEPDLYAVQPFDTFFNLQLNSASSNFPYREYYLNENEFQLQLQSTEGVAIRVISAKGMYFEDEPTEGGILEGSGCG